MRMSCDKLGSYRPHFLEMGCRFGKGCGRGELCSIKGQTFLKAVGWDPREASRRNEAGTG